MNRNLVGGSLNLALAVTHPPNDCATSIKKCDRTFFPNIFVLLQIACTIPVTSCECERNASVLRKLHNYLIADHHDAG